MQPISNISIKPIKPNKGLVAICSFTLFDKLHCSSIGIFTRPQGGYRLVYPTKLVNGTYINIYNPVDRLFGLEIEKEVSKEFQNVINQDVRHNSDNFESRSV